MKQYRQCAQKTYLVGKQKVTEVANMSTKQKNKKFELGNHDFGYHNNVRRDILHLVDDNPGNILDVGGGTGATGSFIKTYLNGSHLSLIDRADVSPDDSVDLFVSGNLEGTEVWNALDDNGATFDTILCLDVLEHLVDPWSVVQKCSERLRSGGTLIVSIPNARNYKLTWPLFFLGRFKLKDYGVMDRTHLRWFVKNSAQELVTCSGLELESCTGGWYMGKSKWWERLANYGFAPGFLYQVYYLKARRG